MGQINASRFYLGRTKNTFLTYRLENATVIQECGQIKLTGRTGYFLINLMEQPKLSQKTTLFGIHQLPRQRTNHRSQGSSLMQNW